MGVMTVLTRIMGGWPLTRWMSEALWSCAARRMSPSFIDDPQFETADGRTLRPWDIDTVRLGNKFGLGRALRELPNALNEGKCDVYSDRASSGEAVALAAAGSPSATVPWPLNEALGLRTPVSNRICATSPGVMYWRRPRIE